MPRKAAAQRVMVTARLPNELMKAVTRRAKAESRSKSSMIERLLNIALDQDRAAKHEDVDVLS